MLTEPGRGFYFEVFPTGLPRNLLRDPRVSILGVNSGRLFWLRALLFGRFPAPPAVRLGGRVVGEPRQASARELAMWQHRVRPLRRLRGYGLLWGRLRRIRVRDLEIDRAEPVRLGSMTEGHWKRTV
ncbi:MAG: pyridoxamine 5'-phosphate oxidase family protein [bacterium]|nr:pyridoxamine 5'-phosphate oxidase family protein [bacterium]